MANLNKPFGLRPLMYGNGAKWNGAATVYVVDSAAAGNFFIGDLVMFAGSADVFGYPTVIKYAGGSAGTANLGAIVGVLPVPPQNQSLAGAGLVLERKSIIATADTIDRYVLVVDDPDVIFEIQSDSTGFARDSIGLNVNVTVNAPASNESRSATVATGAANTATLPFKLIGFSKDPLNEVGAAVNTIVPFVRCLVRPNEHAFKVGILGI